jgi:hypothetical protein
LRGDIRTCGRVAGVIREEFDVSHSKGQISRLLEHPTLARPTSLNGLHTIEFLLHPGRFAGDRLLVIRDGTPIHRRAEVSEFVAET